MRRNPLKRFTYNGDWTVTDHCTGLIWKSAPLDVDVDLDGVPDHTFNFNQAQSVVPMDRTGGYTDWRLPTALELESLLRAMRERGYMGGPPPEFDLSFIDQGPYYWTSSETRLPPGAIGETYGYAVRLRTDAPGIFPNGKHERLRALPVRGPVE